MILDVAQAIMNKFNETPGGDALRLALSGGLFFTEAPDNVAFPYGVFTWDDSFIDEQAGGFTSALEIASISVELYSKNDDGGLEVFDIEEKFIRLFDWSILTYPVSPGYVHVSIRRMSEINRGKIDNVWTINLNYEVQYEH